MWKTWTLAIVLVVVFALNTSSRGQTTLTIGDNAPPITVSKWLKGDPVSQIEKGKVYVFEFWATWCGPCIQLIPHLSELQKRYPEVTFISTDIWEDDVSVVEPFFKEIGPKMEYRVAMDDLTNPQVDPQTGTKSGLMAVNWMRNAGRSTIPSAFVVNQEGKIVFIGHPGRIEKVLKKVLSNEFDMTTAKAEYARQQKLEAEMEAIQAEFITKIYPLLQSKDYDGMDKAFTEMANGHPDIKSTILRLQFLVLLQGKKYDQAYAASDQILELTKEPDDAEPLAQLATVITVQPGIEKRDLDRALKYATKANDLSKSENASILNTIAKIHADKGDNVKAIEYQEKAVEKSVGEDKKLYEEVLAQYKGAEKK